MVALNIQIKDQGFLTKKIQWNNYYMEIVEKKLPTTNLSSSYVEHNSSSRELIKPKCEIRVVSGVRGSAKSLYILKLRKTGLQIRVWTQIINFSTLWNVVIFIDNSIKAKDHIFSLKLLLQNLNKYYIGRKLHVSDHFPLLTACELALLRLQEMPPPNGPRSWNCLLSEFADK